MRSSVSITTVHHFRHCHGHEVSDDVKAVEGMSVLGGSWVALAGLSFVPRRRKMQDELMMSYAYQFVFFKVLKVLGLLEIKTIKLSMVPRKYLAFY